jgi:hypothetical protein
MFILHGCGLGTYKKNLFTIPSYLNYGSKHKIIFLYSRHVYSLVFIKLHFFYFTVIFLICNCVH